MSLLFAPLLSPMAMSEADASPLIADAHTVFAFELAMAALVAVFVLVFALGTYRNASLARSVADVLDVVYAHEFADLRGAGGGGKRLEKDGASYYWYHASGRRNVIACTVFMDLAKRMDVFGYTSSWFMRPQKDRVVMYLPIDADMEYMSMLVTNKKELVRLRDVQDGEAIAAVETFADTPVVLSGLSSEFVVLSEHREIVHALLKEADVDTLMKHARYLNSIHVTESGARWDSQSKAYLKLVRMDFHLPAKTSLHEGIVTDMAKLAVALVDRVAALKLSTAAKKRALQVRKNAQEEVERIRRKRRAEEAAERKQEKRKEEEEAVAKMSRDKQIKYEEKKRKKEMNARIKKMSRR